MSLCRPNQSFLPRTPTIFFGPHLVFESTTLGGEQSRGCNAVYPRLPNYLVRRNLIFATYDICTHATSI